MAKCNGCGSDQPSTHNYCPKCGHYLGLSNLREEMHYKRAKEERAKEEHSGTVHTDYAGPKDCTCRGSGSWGPIRDNDCPVHGDSEGKS